MYHRFHAPHDCHVVGLAHIAGDVWNVNPPTLRRVPRVYCRNERAVLRLRLDRDGHALTLVPVAAVLVAGIRLGFAELPADRFHDAPWTAACDAHFAKGAELGWFEHGSTIIVLAPSGFRPCPALTTDRGIRMGEPLLACPDSPVT
jgi:phosphatidylserine decarboxylase